MQGVNTTVSDPETVTSPRLPNTRVCDRWEKLDVQRLTQFSYIKKKFLNCYVFFLKIWLRKKQVDKQNYRITLAKLQGR